jgi:hypothetical protein
MSEKEFCVLVLFVADQEQIRAELDVVVPRVPFRLLLNRFTGTNQVIERLNGIRSVSPFK